MAQPDLTSIDLRVKVEGKDSINQYPVERENFIRDTCIELSTAMDYWWLKELKTYTIPATKTDWFVIADNFHKIEVVYYPDPNNQNEGKFFKYLSEEDVINQYMEVHTETLGRYRLRWDEANGQFNMALLNGPPAGSTIYVLIKKWLDDPRMFPPYFEETLVKGAVARFCLFLEGDDLPYGEKMMGEYRTLGKQHDKLGSVEVSHAPRRTKTLKELDYSDYNQYRSPG